MVIDNTRLNTKGEPYCVGHITHKGPKEKAIELHATQDLRGNSVAQNLIPIPVEKKPYHIPTNLLGPEIPDSEQYLNQPSVKPKLDQQYNFQDVNNTD